jgi:Undecaprenyl-phosphate glucose phosphotransferase
MLMVSLLGKFGLYDFDTVARWPRGMMTLIAAMAVVEAALIGLGFALKVSEQFSRLWLFGTFLAATVVIIAGRGVLLLVFRYWAKAGALRRNVAIVGAGEQAAAFIEGLAAERAPWQRIVGVFDDRRSRIPPEIAGHPVAGDLDELVRSVRRGAIDVVVVALPWYADARLLGIIRSLRELPVHVYLSPDLIAYRFPAHSHEVLAGVSVLKIAEAPLSGGRAVLKAIEDYVLASLLVILTLPLMAACALAVRLSSPGPILFRQQRYGFNNKPITVLKFRSMYAGRPPEDGVPQATRGDPRITPAGRWLRRTSLDELPQLFNVLNGAMSLVGPRPHAVEHNEKYDALIKGYSARHRVKPGITGLAQVNGLRGETDTLDKMEQRVRFDIHYVETWSLWLDARILLRTLAIAWRQGSAC